MRVDKQTQAKACDYNCTSTSLISTLKITIASFNVKYRRFLKKCQISDYTDCEGITQI